MKKNCLYIVRKGIFVVKKHINMQQFNQFNPLDLMMIPFGKRYYAIDDDFVLADNFDVYQTFEDVLADPNIASFITSPYPFKIKFAMILFCIGGSMRVSLNLVEYKLTKNSILFIQPGDIGKSLEISRDCKIAIIAFSNGYFISEVNSHGAIIVRRFLSSDALLQTTDTEMDEQMRIYQAMYKKMQQPDFQYKKEVLQGYIQILYFNICQIMGRYVERQETQQSDRKKQIFDRFMQLLKQYHSSERSVGFYASKLCITPKYLSQVIYAVSGRHASDWIRNHVIIEAMVLLRSRQYTIQQISDMLNFANQSFFGVYFKRAVGCSPLAYQNK